MYVIHVFPLDASGPGYTMCRAQWEAKARAPCPQYSEFLGGSSRAVNPARGPSRAKPSAVLTAADAPRKLALDTRHLSYNKQKYCWYRRLPLLLISKKHCLLRNINRKK